MFDAIVRNEFCPYCCRRLSPDVHPEVEHFIPNAIYVEPVPQDERPRVMACSRCNKEKGKLDQEWFLHLALCLPNDLMFEEVRQRAKRSMDSEAGRDETDRDRRQARMMRMVAKMHDVINPDETSPLPMLIDPDTGPNGERAALDLDMESYGRWLAFLARGIWTFCTTDVLPTDTCFEFKYPGEQEKDWNASGLRLEPLIDKGVTCKVNGRFVRELNMMIAEIIILDLVAPLVLVAPPHQMSLIMGSCMK